MSPRTTGIIFAIGILGGAAAFWTFGRDDASSAPAKTDPGPGVPRTPAPPRRATAQAAAPPAVLFQQVSMDDDPIGPLRLEGIVLDEDDSPVAGARVFLDSNPPRTTVSAQDGSFLFDKLAGRVYTLSARADGAAGGPVVLRLTADSDPVAIRVREGARVEVTVIAKGTSAPIEGATIGLDSRASQEAVTAADGTATLRGVLPGGRVLYASAPGFARHKQIIAVADMQGLVVRERIELTHGAEISGRVLDPSGKPVANAQVMAVNASEPFVPLNPKLDGVISDAEGRFTIPAVAPGNYRFVAHHAEHPPSSSESIELDGETSRSDIVIIMEMGGMLAGRVVTPQGEAVAWASIHVGPDPNEDAERERGRTAVAEEDGSFRIKGVARAKLVAVATSDAASSELVAVDLRQVPARDDLLLKLTIDGAIAGVVVDEHGEPIAEAQVMALPDFWSGESLDRVIVAGPAFQVTDGGGRFRFRGLADGRYRLRASRNEIGQNAFRLERGIPAAVGDTDVRVVLPAEGGVAGKLVLSNGKVPELASVSVGPKIGVPATGGEFRVTSVPPGTYEVTVRGPQFTDYIAKDVDIAPGEIVDLGTIRLQSGRAVFGRVVDHHGAPVDGATVVTARRLVSDGSNVTPALGALFEESFGLRRSSSDPDGGYRISGIGERELALVADHPDLGRSMAINIPPGTGDFQAELRLVPFGSLQGKVTTNGEPTPSAALIIASPEASEKATIRVQTGLDGTFVVERIPAGAYKVTAAVGAMGSATMASRQVTVEQGKTATIALDISTGNIALEVEVRGENDATIDAAQVFLLSGEIRATSAKQLLQIFSGAATSGARMAFVFPPKTTEFDKIAAGDYSLCAVPITGDMSDPQYMAKLQRNVDALLVHCQPVTVAGSPEKQRFVAVVPPMRPLPE